MKVIFILACILYLSFAIKISKDDVYQDSTPSKFNALEEEQKILRRKFILCGFNSQNHTLSDNSCTLEKQQLQDHHKHVVK